MPLLRSEASTGVTSSASIATSPATAAFSLVPTKAAHVFQAHARVDGGAHFRQLQVVATES